MNLQPNRPPAHPPSIQPTTSGRTVPGPPWFPLAVAIGIGLVTFAAGVRAAETNFALGITKPYLDITLSAPVPGIITVRKFAEGDFVKKGEVILELDQRLEELETERRKIVLEQKRTDFEGTKRLFTTTQGVSKEDLEKKQVEFEVARVEHEMAAEQLRRRHVTASVSGTITEIHLEPGEACQPYQPLLRLVDTRRCYFVTDLDTGAAARLKASQSMKLQFDGPGGIVAIQGRVEFVSPVVDSASSLQRVKLLFENPDGKIPPGISGRLLLE